MSDDVATLIYVENVNSWPPWLIKWADSNASSFTTEAGEVPNFGVEISSEDEFRSNFGNQRVVAHHFTRLLDHEIENIRSDSLRRLTQAMLQKKVDDALDVGALSVRDRDLFARTNVFSSGEAEHREGQICLVVGTKELNDEYDAVDSLLNHWGGEALSMSKWSMGMEGSLMQYGRPAIVVAAIKVSRSHSIDPSYAALSTTFMNSYLGRPAYSDFFLRSSDLSGSDVLDIWQPGNPGYDEFTNFPS